MRYLRTRQSSRRNAHGAGGVPRLRREVLVRKSSWNQTSVQWNADATARCAERREAQKIAAHGRGVFLVCSALRESIPEALRHGELLIVDETVGVAH